MRQAGYEVNFVSKNTDKAGPHGIFKAADPTTSKTGELADVNTVGDYVVEIQITKDGRVVVSDTKTISIIDVESTTSALKTVKFKVGEIELNSTTLVVDDKAKIFEIIGDAAGKKDVKLPVSSAKVTSSNPAVISVDGDTLTANSVGTSTITVKVGDISKTINMTVANKARAVEKVTAYESTAKVVEGQTRSIEVTAVDQYGDPIELDGSEIYVDNPDTAKVDEDEEVVTNEKGKGTYKVKGLEKGTGSILFKKKDENGAIIGKIAVQVTDVDNITSEKVEHTTVKALKTTVEKGKTTDPYQVSQFNSNGFYNGPATLGAGGYVVESANDKVATVASTGNSFTITGVKAGTTDITVKDDKGFVKHKLTITVTEEKNVITKVNFKDQVTIDYVGKVIEVADVLDVREQEGTDDAIVYGIEHNVATVNKVRITDDNKLYIDKNDDGDFDTADGDIQLGSVTAEVLTGAEGLNPFTLGTTKTVAGDKGQILFRVLEGDSTDNKDTIATTLLNVNVKK